MKILIYFLFLVLVVNSHLRDLFLAGNQIGNVVIGSIPNFIAAMIIPLSFADYYYKLQKYNTIVVFMTGILLIIEEFYPVFSGNKVFDKYDIIFTVIGSVLSYLIIHLCKNNLRKIKNV